MKHVFVCRSVGGQFAVLVGGFYVNPCRGVLATPCAPRHLPGVLLNGILKTRLRESRPYADGYQKLSGVGSHGDLELPSQAQVNTCA